MTPEPARSSAVRELVCTEVAMGMSSASVRRTVIGTRSPVVTIGAALLVVIVGVLIAVLANSTIGMIVAAIGVIGLIIALVSGSRARL